ncbi:MAG: hypothetical protein H0U75_13050 [Legionella sp.]|nr:hypothetical protein [Legionella sp.]
MRAIKTYTLILLVVFTSNAMALKQTIYASNNSDIIPLNTAYQRLQSEPEHQLQVTMIQQLQQAHIQQGQFQEILGTYLMSTTGDLTGDNTEAFTFSPYQKIPNEQLFELSKTLAQKLNQDSLAVVVADEPEDGTTPDNCNHESIVYSLSFKKQPELSMVLEKIKLLPTQYQSAYSIQISDLKQSFTKAGVNKINWLGHGFDINELKQIFPEAEVSTEKGSAWLVFKDGHIKEL